MKPLVLLVLFTLGACASVEVNRSGLSATTLTDLHKRVGLMGSISVPSGSLLINANLDGQQAYCTPFKAFHSLDDNRAICFEDPQKSGIFTSYYILGSLRSLKSEVSIPYVLEGDAKRLDPNLGSAIVEAQADRERQQDAVDTIRAKQIAGVKLTIDEARTLIKADRNAQIQQAEALRNQQASAANAQRSAAARQAAAECQLRSHIANWNTPGLVPGLIAGAIVSSECESYYRNAGVMP